MLGVASAMVIAFTTPVALAQETAAAEQTLSLEAQPLGDALIEISDMFGVTVLATESMVAGKTAPTLSGTYSAQGAINALLAGSGLSASPNASGDFIVAEAAAQQDARRPSDTRPIPAVEPLVAETIIVTGTKQNLSLQDTQASVAVLSSQAIEEQAIFNLTDALLRTPNVSTATEVQELSIRGIGIAGVGQAGNGATANVYVDGAPASSSALQGAFNLWDVSQIEILRGPQSTVQGRNALAGAIIVQTADPEYEYGARVRARAGNNDHLQFSGAVTGPIIEDQVAFRLAADYREIDYGVTDANTGNPAFFEEDLTLRGKLLLEPSALPGLRVELNGQHIQSEGGADFSIFSPVLFSDPAFSDFDPFGDETFPQVSFREQEVSRGIIDASYLLSPNWEVIFLGTYEKSEGARQRSTGFNENEQETYSFEFRTNFEYDRMRGWIGAYYFSEDTTSDNAFIVDLAANGLLTDPAGGIVTSLIAIDRQTDNYAFFADFTYDLTERLSINLGARYDIEDVTDSGNQGSTTVNVNPCTIPAFGGIPCAALFPTTTDPQLEADYSAFLPRGSIIYSLDDSQTISFSVQRGYRAGGASTESTPIGAEIREFDPEFITNYELAYRSQWLDDRLVVNANVFFADWTDQQVRIRDQFAGTTFFVLNAGSSETYGAEFSVAYEATEELDLFASLGLLETEFTDFPFAVDGAGVPLPGDGVTVPVGDTQFANLAGNEFPAAPNVTASAGFNYDRADGLFLSANAAFTDAQFSDVENLEANETDSYVLVNGRAGYRFGGYEIALFANNLFDERFVTRQFLQGVTTNNNVVSIGDANGQFRVNTPRIFGVELLAEF